MTGSCRLCEQPAAVITRTPIGELALCGDHAARVRAAGKELAGAGARALGTYVEAKAPRAMAAGAALYGFVRWFTQPPAAAPAPTVTVEPSPKP